MAGSSEQVPGYRIINLASSKVHYLHNVPAVSSISSLPPPSLVSMNASPQIPANIARIAGPLLIGYLLDWGMFGVLSMQVYIYYLAFLKDPIFNLGLVYGIYVLMLVQTVLFSQSSFHTFGNGFGNVDTIGEITEIWFSVPIISAVVALIVQAFYALQIWAMSRAKLIPLFIVLLAVTQFGGGIWTGVVGHDAVKFSRFMTHQGFVATGVWNGSGALCDILITACMSYYYLSPSSTYKLKGNRVPTAIRAFIMSGGLLTLIAVINTALSLLPNGQTYFQTTSAILGNMYANTFMALLNSRVRFARPSGYVDDQASRTYLTYDQPVRSALVFARSAGGGEGGETRSIGEGEMEGEEDRPHDEHNERTCGRNMGRSIDTTGMTMIEISEEDRRKDSMGPESPDTCVASPISPNESTALRGEEV
ncbi:hypothetical protein CPB84DRAFT_1961525 [Gymnopilus junonius]|uniref:DUF6534 domain-containing protein n=1 Tax=Gymnopilus junonius TaxID=109634 RepID=A0A9P5NMX6_GYMJU|nr:hypothetical protein CPB84DRAFT_1961525 [Gymnopilus junonius]